PPTRTASPTRTTRYGRARGAAWPGSRRPRASPRWRRSSTTRRSRGARGRPRGVALVAPLIPAPSVEVRAEAASAIGRLGDEDAAMLLFELLGDESELIQESAIGALARMPSEPVVPLLVQALNAPDV